MFFNKSLQQENQRLKQELYSLQQIQQSLDEEMLRLTLDAKGNVTSANQKFCSNFHCQIRTSWRSIFLTLYHQTLEILTTFTA